MGPESLFSIKNAALAALVLQNTFLVVVMRYSRTLDGPMYASSTAVVCMEVLKFVTCVGVICHEEKSITKGFQRVSDETLGRPMELAKLSVPSFLYVIQNNLLYYALSHLDTPTFQVGYQTKILTTALFSLFMLGKRLSYLQWISLVILTIGVALAQMSANANAKRGENTTLGFIAVCCAAVTSGFSGVYFERILKGGTTSLWSRNVQMGGSSVLLGILSVLVSNDRTQVLENGFFHGYNSVVWTVIFLQGFGGLVVAVVVKYADNILKGFAASFSIITSCILCIWFFDFKPNALFATGAILVNISMYMYGYKPSAQQVKASESIYSAKKEEEAV
jgi:UDP-sugar transporter A1/2/3